MATGGALWAASLIHPVMNKHTASTLTRVATLVAIFATASVHASNPENITVNSNVPTVANLAVNTNSVTMDFNSGDYNTQTGDAFKTVLNGSDFQIATNRNWTLSVKAGSATFAFTPAYAGDTASKQSTDLGFTLSGGSSYVGITTSDQTVTTGSRGGYGTSGNSPSVDYTLFSNLNQDSPGQYSLTLIYTLTSS